MNVNQKKRKYQLPDFRDLFSALFKIKDLEVQNRVLDAINGITTIDINTHCGYCGNRKKMSTIEVASQTDDDTSTWKIGNEIESDNSIMKDETSKFVRKRKHAKKIPRVEKSTPIKPTLELISSKHQKRIKPCKTIDELELDKYLNLKNDTLAEIFCELDVNKTINISINELETTMQMELTGCLKYLPNYQFYLPIHQAIVSNDSRKLMLQKFVLQYRNIKLNDLYTKSECPENPIQLAIKANCIPKILIELFNYKYKSDFFDDVDCNQNTLLHLAMLNLEVDNVETFKVVIDNMPNLKILSKTNEQGQTAFHIGINLNKVIFCQMLLFKIDEKLNIARKIPTLKLDEKMLTTFYEKEMISVGTGIIVDLNKEKIKILNAIDLKHGKTPLLFSLATKNRLISLMLLYNGADPRIKDYSQNEYFDVDDLQLQGVLNNVSTYLDEYSKSVK